MGKTCWEKEPDWQHRRKVAFIHLLNRYIQASSDKSSLLFPAQPWRTICRDREEVESLRLATKSIQRVINNSNGPFSLILS